MESDSTENKDKEVLSPTPSPECSGTDDEEASRESYGVSSIRLFDTDVSMTGGSTNNNNNSNVQINPINFASLQSDHLQLSSSLPSTSINDSTTTEPVQSTSNIAGRKRTFSITENQKPNDKRTATKICRVCSDKAYSYNFNVITCESCKAFFRRNANKEKEIRCPFNGQCDINIVSRRFCQKCRLEKCFKVGMKKEWIMSEEARLEKKKRIMDNRERRAAEKNAEEKHKQNNSDDLAAAIVGQSKLQLQQGTPSAVAQVAAALLPQVQNNVPFNSGVPNVSPLLTTTGQTQPEVAQLAAAVAQVAANQAQTIPNTTFQGIQTQNDAGQIATERALMASIAANASSNVTTNQVTQQQPQTTSQFVPQQQQIVNPLAVAQAQLQQAQMEQQLQQQVHVQQNAAVQAAVQAQQIAAVQAAQVQAAAIVQHQQQQQQLQAQAQIAAAVAAAASSIVPTVATTVVVPTVPSITSTTTTVAPQTSNDLVTIPRDMLLKLVEQKIESEQSNQQHHQQGNTQIPLKCQCRCQCGRYPNDLLIVDKVMTDLLESSAKYNNSKPLSQLSPKTEQPTPPLNMISTTPPQNNLMNQVTTIPAMNLQNSNQITFQQPITTNNNSINSATTTTSVPVPMEEDYVFKSIRTAAC